MVVCNSPNIVQEKKSELFEGLDMERAYIDDVLVITKNNSNEHVKESYRVLQIPTEARLKVNAEKSFSGQTETEYIGF